MNSWNNYSISSGKSLASGFANRRMKEIEEEEKRREEQAIINQQKENAQKSGSGDERPWWKKVGDFTEESNKALMGGTIKGLASTVNFVGSGFNGEEADRRTKEFMKGTGLEDEKGLSASEKYKGNIINDVGRKMRGEDTSDSFMTDMEEDMEVRKNQEDIYSRAGSITGSVQKGAVDLATIALPGVAAEKALRGTKLASTMLQGGRASKVAANVGLSVGGGMASTAVGAVKDPESLTGANVATNVGIDAAIGAASPALGHLYRTFKQGRAAAKDIKNVAKSVYDDTLKQGGTTIDIAGNRADAGYAYSPFKDAETVVDKAKFTQKDVESFVKAHQKELADPANKIGAWEEDGKIYLDISRVGDNVDDVVEEAAQNNQLGVFDLSKGETINVGSLAEDGTYNRFAATHDSFKYDEAELPQLQEEMQRTAQQLDEVVQSRANAPAAEADRSEEVLRTKLEQLQAATIKKQPDEALRAQIDDFLAGNGRTGDVRADYDRMQTLKDELGRRERDAYWNTIGKTKEEAQKALDEFDAGNIPDTALKPATPVSSLDEILERQDLPQPIKETAQELAEDRQMIESQMEGLMTPDVKAEEIMRLDEMYETQIGDLQRRYSSLEQPTRAKDTTVDQTVAGQRLSGDYKSDVRFTVAKDKLDNEYREAVAELDLLEAEDLEEVSRFEEMLDNLEVREQTLVADTRDLMRSAPDEFRDVDADEVAAIRAELESHVEQANRFDTPEGIIEEVSTSPNPVKSFDEHPGAEAAYSKKVGEEIDQITDTTIADNFKSITGTKLAAMRVMSPSQVFERWGLRGEALDIHSNILKAESAVNAANKADSDVLTRISQSLPNSNEAQAQIIDYLQGNRKTLTAIDDVEAADMIRAWLDEKRAGVEAMGYKTMDDYFPHMFDKSDPDVQRLFKGKTKADINFGNLKQRLTDSDDYSRDIMGVLTKYASSYNRKALLEPALKPLDDIRLQVTLAGAESKWLDDYVKQLKGFDESKIGEAYNSFIDGVMEKMGKTAHVGNNHYTATLGTQRMVSAMATMGINPGTAIRNTTQMVNTVADIGPRYSLLGMWDGTKALRAGPGSAEWKELQRVGIMEGGVSQNYFDAITNPGVRGRIAKSRDATVKGMMSMIRGTDVALRAQAYYGAKALAAKKGLVGEAAENFAIRKVIDSQFITSRVDMPVAFNGQGIRSMTQLATFSGKQAGFLKRMGVKMVKGADGKGFQIQDMGSVLAAVGTAWMATEALKPLMGFRETEWIPFYEQIAPFIPGPMGDEASGDSLYRSPLVRLMAGDGKGKMGLFEAIQTGDVGEFIGDNWSQIIPGGTQIKKTVEGFGTTTSGVSTNDKGNIRFAQDEGWEDVAKASVFGQYSTQAGQDWIKQGFPTLSEKQTATVNSLPPEAQEMYVDFYQAKKAASGRQKAYDEAKAAAKSGNYNGAVRAAEAYNKALDEAMAQYWQKYDEMPADLQEEMLRSRIDARRIMDNQED